MDLGLSDSEQLVKQTARSFVERFGGREPLVALQAGDLGYDPRWLPAMAEAGWLGMLVPTADGAAAGATVLQTALVFEELGRGPLPGPWLASSVIGAGVIAACATPGQAQPLLSALAAGEVILVPTQWGPVFDGGAPAPMSEGDTTLRTSRPFVPYAGAATHLLVDLPGVASGGSPSFAVVPRDHPRVRLRRLSGWNAWSFAVDLDDVPLSECTVLTGTGTGTGTGSDDGTDGTGRLERVLDVARAVLAAYQVGGCARLLELSVDYSATRIQFGIPIGRFQRVQDHVVRIANALDAARWSTYEAIWRLDTGRPAAVSVSLAASLASEGYMEAANAAHEVHAGIGSDPAFGLTLFSQMSRSLYHYLGGPRWHKRRLGDLLAAGAPGAATV